MKDSNTPIYPLFRTPVEVEKPRRELQAGDKFLFLGSCFAEHIGGEFVRHRLDALVNPLGVVYNPKSIASEVREALNDKEQLDEKHFLLHDGLWHCWLAHGSFSHEERARCEAAVSEGMGLLRQRIKEADFIFITLGTNHCYELRETGLVVSNCHKVPGREFVEREMPLEDVVECLEGLMSDIRRVNPTSEVAFTVSPYRYRKYGFHGSQLGKATLLLAADRIVQTHAHTSYFPAYEIVMDELRDYRFYADDMLHPSDQAVAYIWERLKLAWMSPAMREQLKETLRIIKAEGHRRLVER